MSSFGRYAEYYDILYRDKDYAGECAFVEQALGRYLATPARTLLDVGCGTGGHAILLASMGYEVSGIDLSEAMLARAKAKAHAGGLKLSLRVMDMRRLALGMQFDACLCMFAALGYLSENEDVRSGLRSIREHVRPGGLLVFDCWNGLAVLRQMPSVRIKEMEDGGRRLMRIAEPELDAARHLCHVHYHLIVTAGGSVVDETRETHVMRFLFPQEIAYYLDDAGFELLRLCPFGDLDGAVNEAAWNIAVVARARDGA